MANRMYKERIAGGGSFRDGADGGRRGGYCGMAVTFLTHCKIQKMYKNITNTPK